MTGITKRINHLAIKTKQVPKMVIVGLLGVIFLYVSASGLISVTYPWLEANDNDQIAHIDMIYRIYNGDLPKSTDGVRYQPFIEHGVGNIYQRASGHPPLFHTLMAPFMGPLLNKGEWRKAIAVGRAINIFIGILCIFALAWAGWLLGGKRKALFAVAVPALAVLAYRFSRVNTDLSMDVLLTLWSTLTLINLYKILQNGLKIKYLIPLALLSAAGMATKASYGVFLVLSLAVIIWASYIHGGEDKLKKFIKGSIVAAVILTITVAAIGWYYYLWNYRSGGSLISPIRGGIETSRPYLTYKGILSNANFWSLFYARITVNVVISTIITSFGVAGFFAMKRIKLIRAKKDPQIRRAFLLMLLAFAGIVATQIKLAHPQGSINFRYLLPALLPISLFLAYGLLEFKWLRGQLVALAAIAMAWTTILSIRLGPTPEGLLQGVKEWGKDITKIFNLAAQNGVPAYVTKGLFLIFIAGSLLLSLSLYRLSKTNRAG